MPLAAFLPCEGRTGAARFRIYEIARALRPLGWRTLVLPSTLTHGQRQTLLARARPDILVMQGARHDLNRPENYPGFPIAYDMDDADFHLPHLEELVRNAMPQTDLVIAGSHYIAEWCRDAGAPQTQVIWTSANASSRPRPPQSARPAIIAWAQTRSATYAREAKLVRDVITRLAVSNPGLTLRLYDKMPGDDPAFANSFRAPGLTVEWRPRMPYSSFLASLDDVALGLAPLRPETPFSRGKSFGKTLAYMDRDVPILASDIGEQRAAFTPDMAVLSNDPDVWVSEGSRILQDPAVRTSMVTAARRMLETRLSISAAARRTDRVLREVMRSRQSTSRQAIAGSPPKTA